MTKRKYSNHILDSPFLAWNIFYVQTMKINIYYHLMKIFIRNWFKWELVIVEGEYKTFIGI